MTRKAKRPLIVVGAILIALFPLSRWIASEYLRHVPRQYFSAVTVEIKVDTFNRAVGISDSMSSGRIDPEFLALQIQRIKSAEILTPVIEKLDLVKKFSPPGMAMPMQWVTEVLSRSIFVREQRNTTLIEIGIYHTDKQLAADIANTVAITYRDKRIEDMRKVMDLTLAEMKDELKAKEDELNKLFQEASRIRQAEKIVDPDPESANAVPSLSVETVDVEKRARVDQLRKQLARIEQLKPEELMEALRMLNISDQTVEMTLSVLQDARAEEAKLLSEGFDENHPRVKSLRAKREVYAKQLSDMLESIKRSQKTKLAIEEATLKDSESPRKPAIPEKTRMNRYVEKKAAYLMAKKLLLRMQQRYDADRFAMGHFDHPQVPVKIWQPAQPAQVPARPEAVHIMRCVNVIGGSLGVIGMLMILIGACIPSRIFSRAEVQE